MVLALIFAELLAGGIMLVAGVTGHSIPEVIKGEDKPVLPLKESKPVFSSEETSSGVKAGTKSAAIIASSASGRSGGFLSNVISQLGTPYKWGGEAEKIGFDCSGLVQWAAAKAGVSLPRTAQEQYTATERVGTIGVLPGDLAFFGTGPSNITHVGVVTGPGEMIDATHTGANVEHSLFNPKIGSASFGNDKLVGYGRL